MALLKVVTVDTAKEELTKRFGGIRMGIETIPVNQARDRFLACDVSSADPVPHFPRSTMDGYAVKAAETAGASDTIPSLLRIAGEVAMGRAPGFTLGSGEAAYVPTGGMIPEGADSVIMVEYTEVLGREVAVTVPGVFGKHIVPPGQDMAAGEVVLPAGRRLASADLGVLTAVGITEVEVYKKPVAVILSTGDEITPPSAPLEPGRVRDINSWTIAAEAERMGFRILRTAVIGDDRTALEAAVREAMAEADILFLSGGSSAGKKDYTIDVFNSIGAPGCFVHGIAFNPGKPTILAEAEGFPLVGLPGHPVSSLMVFRVLGKHLLYLLNGSAVPPSPWFSGVLTENVHASPGRDTYRLVQLQPAERSTGQKALNGEAEWQVVPVKGESGMITTLSRAEGYMIISRDSEGLPAGARVKVYPL